MVKLKEKIIVVFILLITLLNSVCFADVISYSMELQQEWRDGNPVVGHRTTGGEQAKYWDMEQFGKHITALGVMCILVSILYYCVYRIIVSKKKDYNKKINFICFLPIILLILLYCSYIKIKTDEINRHDQIAVRIEEKNSKISELRKRKLNLRDIEKNHEQIGTIVKDIIDFNEEYKGLTSIDIYLDSELIRENDYDLIMKNFETDKVYDIRIYGYSLIFHKINK